MALTLKKLKRLESVGATKHFAAHRAKWKAQAQSAHNYMRDGFDGEQVRKDDIVTPLVSVVEIDADYRKFRAGKKLNQLYYINDFAEYVIDQVWDEVS